MVNSGRENRGFRHNKNQNKKQKHPVNASDSDDLNPVIEAFTGYAVELDDKHDRFERIVKLSRDITIESKRIIFLLHTIDPKKNNSEKILDEASNRLENLIKTNFFAIAKELNDLDIYQYARAYSAGLQEYIEAFTFFELMSHKKLSDWSIFQEKMKYEVEIIEKEPSTTTLMEDGDKKAESHLNITEICEKKKYLCFIQPMEYILGLSDTTGEIMRRCINSLGSGDIDSCFQSCKILQAFYSCYLGLNFSRQKDLSRKIFTLRQSVQKAENVCYNIRLRGREAAIWGGTSFGTCNIIDNEQDEGCF